jgi:DNA adenine methylase
MAKYRRPPFAYYGGKQSVLEHIIPYIPGHECYVEPFAGGASVYFAKSPAPTNVLNDANERLTSFYRTVKDPTKAREVAKRLQGTLYARSEYEAARVINRAALSDYDELTRAWAVVLGYCMSYGAKWDSGFNCSASPSRFISNCEGWKDVSDSFLNRVELLRQVIIENRDALKVIQTYDRNHTFFFVDPPYIGTNCQGLGDYTESDYVSLINLLSTIKGKFMLTSYENPVLNEAISNHRWNIRSLKKCTNLLAAEKYNLINKTRIECFVTNYKEPIPQLF